MLTKTHRFDDDEGGKTSDSNLGTGAAATKIVIIGAGFSGLAAGIRLLQSGRQDFVIIERGDEVGGTWRDNSYPGSGCDIPSLVYSFSFAPSARWQSAFASQEEILEYLKECAERFGLRRHIRFGESLQHAEWDESRSRWVVATDLGAIEAETLVLATGYLSEPRLPRIDGIDGFAGRLLHTARWDHDLDLAGKNVAVIGTGASAIQLIPEIAPDVGQLTVYQSTPAWVNAKADVPVTDRERRRREQWPGYQRLQRNFNKYGREIIAFLMARPELLKRTLQPQLEAFLEQQVPDESLRRMLTPDYVAGCKRILFSNDYYPALNRENVTLVPHAAESFGPTTITAAGVERPHDVVVLATGFNAVHRAAAGLIHAGGRSLAEVWRESMEAYVGTSVHGFPNLVTMLGPNTALGHHSQTMMLEAQADYLVATLDYMQAQEIHRVEVRRDAQDHYNAWLEKKLAGTVWQDGGCVSWYQDETRRNPNTYPTYTWNFRRHLRRFRPEHHHLATRPVTSKPDQVVAVPAEDLPKTTVHGIQPIQPGSVH